MICDQTVSAKTQTRTDKISKPSINLRLLVIFQVLKFSDFIKIWGCGGHLEEAALKKNNFCYYLCLVAHNFGKIWSIQNIKKVKFLVCVLDSESKSQVKSTSGGWTTASKA